MVQRSRRYSAHREPSLPTRSRVQSAWIIGQNNAIRPCVMIVLTSPVDQNTPRLPCEASNNESAKLQPAGKISRRHKRRLQSHNKKTRQSRRKRLIYRALIWLRG